MGGCQFIRDGTACLSLNHRSSDAKTISPALGPSGRISSRTQVGILLESRPLPAMLERMAPPPIPTRSSKGTIGSSFCRAMTRTRSLPWRIWPINSGSHPSSWESSTRVARWCTHAATLGVSSSSRICSRSSSKQSMTRDLAREEWFRNVGLDRTHLM